jgi:hypothetical protein
MTRSGPGTGVLLPPVVAEAWAAGVGSPTIRWRHRAAATVDAVVALGPLSLARWVGDQIRGASR